MAKRVGLVALGVTVGFVLWPFVMGIAEGSALALVPTAEERLYTVLSVVVVFIASFAIAYAVQWWRRRSVASR